jgi:hypothetical protein
VSLEYCLVRLPFIQQNLMESGSKVQNGEPRSTI